MARKRAHGRVVSATQIAALLHCEQKVRLDTHLGERVTQRQRTDRARGDAYHLQAHEAAVSAHNQPRRPTVRKGPCFVATLVYGYDDPRTDEFRLLRDRHLRNTRIGRWAIVAYYHWSPSVVTRLQGHPAAIRMIRAGLDALRITLTPWIGDSSNGSARQPLRPD